MTQPAIVGIDLGKNWFHLIGVDDTGATVFRKKMNPSQLAHVAATAPQCIVATDRVPGRSTGAGCLQRRATRSVFCRRNS